MTAKTSKKPPIKERAAKKRGRPKGSKNVGVVVRATPTRCFKCGSTDTVMNGETRPPHEVPGVDREGNPYTRVTWHRMNCKACGQWVTVRKPHYDPAKWVGAEP